MVGPKSETSQVKGTILIDYARIVRANRDRNWKQWLTAEDFELIDGKLLPSTWYPYAFFGRLAYAVFKEIAGGNLKTAQQFGRFNIRNQMEIYKNLLQPGDPVASVKSLANLRRTFFRGDFETRVTGQGERSLTYEVSAFPEEDNQEKIQAFIHQMSGNLLEIAEQAGGKNPEVEIKGSGHQYQIILSWE